MHRYIIMSILLLASLAACQSAHMQPLEQRVPDVPTEILFHEPVMDSVRSSDMQFFGIGLADTIEDIEALHGPADVREEYNFGRVVNLAYRFGENESVVLYNTDLGYVRGILVLTDAANLLAHPNLLGQDKTQVYSVLRTPTRLNPIPMESQMIYDPLGYEVYVKSGKVDRIYFTLPDRGITPAGRDVENPQISDEQNSADTNIEIEGEQATENAKDEASQQQKTKPAPKNTQENIPPTITFK